MKVLLENKDNDKRLWVELPIIPRIGDWIRLDFEDEFTDGETILTVYHVILTPDSKDIKIVLSNI